MAVDEGLRVTGLRTEIRTKNRTIHAVDGVDLQIEPGETVCLVGESGSGKSVCCESITGIVPQPPAKIVEGSITFAGHDLRESESLRRKIRGDRIAHVFQNPQGALDPVYPIGKQIIEAIRIHESIPKSEARTRAVELLRRVGIPEPRDRLQDYPHEFSGGMRQRVAIAVAIAAEPELLIADEPTTAVDVTVQARLIELLDRMTQDGMGMLLVTHDLRVAASLADRVLVMYGGTIVERGGVEEIFSRPAHPYTQALFESYRGEGGTSNRLARGDIPSNGCRFRRECPHAVDACASEKQPTSHPVDTPAHTASCVYYDDAFDENPLTTRAQQTSPVFGEVTDD